MPTRAQQVNAAKRGVFQLWENRMRHLFVWNVSWNMKFSISWNMKFSIVRGLLSFLLEIGITFEKVLGPPFGKLFRYQYLGDMTPAYETCLLCMSHVSYVWVMSPIEKVLGPTFGKLFLLLFNLPLHICPQSCGKIAPNFSKRDLFHAQKSPAPQ